MTQHDLSRRAALVTQYRMLRDQIDREDREPSPAEARELERLDAAIDSLDGPARLAVDADWTHG